MKLFSVINIDIVASRNIKNRQIVQEELIEYIKKLNIELKDILATSITFTLGDEWQIVLKQPSKSYYVVDKFQKFLKSKGINIYAGIGIGTISTSIYSDTRLMDGECFLIGREALNIVKEKNRFYSKQLNSTKNNIYFSAKNMFFVKLPAEKSTILEEVAITREQEENYDLSINKVINTLIENNEVLKSGITSKQLEIIELYERLGSYNNIIKENPGLSKANISQKINASNYFVINNNNLIIESMLDLYCNIRKGN
ncbi:SatD family protein [Clostridium sp. MSJ-11]|uniref:SatD family protein n=1 Tax=Clostridium mobile TaxID=2841512 RepID=A0ABS6EHP9_9CLOT|nr:SatD family protein [Clostridium mobile]MBU5484758.1 SatD family protein [Clostridium mobile]